MSLEKKTVDYVAHLSRIDLNPDQSEKLSGQLKEILDFIDKLKNADISGVEPTSHILALSNVMRNDSSRQSLKNEKALGNAPRTDGNFFVVPKVIE